MKYNIDPQIKPFCISIPFNAVITAISHAPMDIMLKFIRKSGIDVKKDSYDGCPIYIVEPKGVGCGTPCIVFYHGGGFGFKAAPHHKSLALKLSDELKCRVVLPDYRLLPKFKYPAAREDALKAYRFACERFPESELAILGDSAGGALSVYAVYDAEKAGLKMPKLQMLLYPVADANCNTESMKKYTDTPLWNAKNNKVMWSMYLGNNDINEASPMHMPLCENIPDAYIETAEFDCLHDEGINYAEKLKAAGAKVELHQTKGTPHGYDIAGRSKVMKECMRHRIYALKKAFEIGIEI